MWPLNTQIKTGESIKAMVADAYRRLDDELKGPTHSVAADGAAADVPKTGTKRGISECGEGTSHRTAKRSHAPMYARVCILVCM